ncbi:pseudouridine synthase [Chitinophaga nivalis]|uniref:Pseudouridine synthase n=1 Tax=Chitinophaga nivalis TaxID=2991709 RepID=A0ABT3IJI0_9BACT|nr:pseudouridine synthase [Chitinophaga nivalis]MCW3466201.1 pseudouridine synthase [Chitinophaga nivalis]MCW3484108.1 pseudouridine synthase [Chitinophaga nivalis]
MEHRYFIVNKPFNMVSQFVSPDPVNLLGDLSFDFPEGTHAIGRLDNDSEGLLILTTNKKVTRLLFNSGKAHERTYLVRVKGVMSEASLKRLQTGVPICLSGQLYYTTPPCRVEITERPPGLFNRPQELTAAAPHTWLYITLTEGKFRQVRKMVDAVRHRCQRLIRVSIEDLQLGDLAPGAVRELSETAFFTLLKIDPDRD